MFKDLSGDVQYEGLNKMSFRILTGLFVLSTTRLWEGNLPYLPTSYFDALPLSQCQQTTEEKGEGKRE